MPITTSRDATRLPTLDGCFQIVVPLRCLTNDGEREYVRCKQKRSPLIHNFGRCKQRRGSRLWELPSWSWCVALDLLWASLQDITDGSREVIVDLYANLRLAERSMSKLKVRVRHYIDK